MSGDRSGNAEKPVTQMRSPLHYPPELLRWLVRLLTAFMVLKVPPN